MQSYSQYALILLLFLCIQQLYYLAKAQLDIDALYNNCNSALFPSGSVYGHNLNLTLTWLAGNASLNGGFYNITVGQNLDTVYGLVQCTAYISAKDCQNFADIAAKRIRGLCSNKKEASVGNDNCLIHYSNQLFFSTFNSGHRYSLANPNSVTDPVIWNRQIGNLLKNLSSDAATAPARFASGTATYKDADKIYAMVQCTRDLTEKGCLTCLEDVIGYITQYCDGSTGCRIYSESCLFRYESYSFFLSAPSPELGPSPSPFPVSNSAITRGNKIAKKTVVIIAAILVVVSLSVIFVICACYSIHGDGNGSLEVLVIGLRTIKVATENFSNAFKLGEGGFGPVYKGILGDGQEIAVKRLSSHSGQGLDELKTEVMLVAQLLHRNLVKLLGYCLENEEKLLVYEYVPNGSLDKILFDDQKQSSLEWKTRFKIIVGIARGLLYLHEDSQLRVIHRDLKASNILLDENLNPKISDFGLAKMFSGSQTQANTRRICGTYGYMAPEYVKHGKFSTKSDVYSFGILVLEIITGQKISSPQNYANLQSHAWQHWTNGIALELMDPTMDGHWSKQEVLSCIHIGLLCVQEAAINRPKMSNVITMFSNLSVSHLVPSRPAFFVSDIVSDSSELVRENPGSTIKASNRDPSVYGVTLTELHPRD
ncbi:cysteine-rich receptor-like protein kinase 10 [Ziziphus jujuba]|uniref:Cysteine-rich receptor-like protein kinase 10 n=1 Tax=Ziziphus jujuba TaxID=326968 RepID=A0ABM4A6P1_ZIZJJ|nr:cysteine-rich receptor-like protein kinase 10 [Ziziphus jujuba]